MVDQLILVGVIGAFAALVWLAVRHGSDGRKAGGGSYAPLGGSSSAPGGCGSGGAGGGCGDGGGGGGGE